MSKKVYTLTIEYDSDNEQIEFVREEIIEDEVATVYGEIDMEDYFDKETLELLKGLYILGDA
jgi:hypothetical protein|tara:strand:- start:57 stop:242 length:186 start_codon:yes stop_codon:yes gene_type:complete